MRQHPEANAVYRHYKNHQLYWHIADNVPLVREAQQNWSVDRADVMLEKNLAGVWLYKDQTNDYWLVPIYPNFIEPELYSQKFTVYQAHYQNMQIWARNTTEFMGEIQPGIFRFTRIS